MSETTFAALVFVGGYICGCIVGCVIGWKICDLWRDAKP